MTRGPDKQFDREAVLERAMEAFWAGGCEATGVSDLLKTMGIGRQSLYDTFGDKRSLFLETLRHYFRTRVEPAMAGLRAEGFSEAIVAAVDALTGRPGETYEDLVRRARGHPLAHMVKAADLADNIARTEREGPSAERDDRLGRYRAAQRTLREGHREG